MIAINLALSEKNSKLTSSYAELLAEVRTKVDAFLASTANEYIPKMYQALRNENRDSPGCKTENSKRLLFVLLGPVYRRRYEITNTS